MTKREKYLVLKIKECYKQLIDVYEQEIEDRKNLIDVIKQNIREIDKNIADDEFITAAIESIIRGDENGERN